MPPSQAPAAIAAPPERFKSKTLTALLALVLGCLGAHRFYLYGLRDRYGWTHVVGTLAGLAGVDLLLASNLMSARGWVLTVCGSVSLFSAFLAAIVYGLRPDDRWNAQFNRGTERRSQSGWFAVIIVGVALFVGTFLMMLGLAVAFQTYFETHLVQNALSN